MRWGISCETLVDILTDHQVGLVHGRFRPTLSQAFVLVHAIFDKSDLSFCISPCVSRRACNTAHSSLLTQFFSPHPLCILCSLKCSLLISSPFLFVPFTERQLMKQRGSHVFSKVAFDLFRSAALFGILYQCIQTFILGEPGFMHWRVSRDLDRWSKPRMSH